MQPFSPTPPPKEPSAQPSAGQTPLRSEPMRKTSEPETREPLINIGRRLLVNVGCTLTHRRLRVPEAPSEPLCSLETVMVVEALKSSRCATAVRLAALEELRCP